MPEPGPCRVPRAPARRALLCLAVSAAVAGCGGAGGGGSGPRLEGSKRPPAAAQADDVETFDPGPGAQRIELGADPDGDGFITLLEMVADAGGGLRPVDTDADGAPDHEDADADGDGLPDAVEGIGDRDADGVPNLRDADSDGDGVPDGTGSGQEGTGDADADGVPDFLDAESAEPQPPAPPSEPGLRLGDDPDGDGLPTFLELRVDAEGGLAPVDTDGDGAADHEDADADDDGLGDGVEGMGDPDRDGLPNFRDPDSDGDAILDGPGAGREGTADRDGDGVPDFLDPTDDDPAAPAPAFAFGEDPDGDGLQTYLELVVSAGGRLQAVDTDGDGRPDHEDADADGDGIGDAVEGLVDTDSDGLADFRDTDADGDGLDDADEGTGDADEDGRPDFRDRDSDGDGIPDGNAEGTEGLTDTDGDGTADFRDRDADGDGLADRDEGVADPDEDQLPSFRDPDSDGDGVGDGVGEDREGLEDTDGDGLGDFLDTDSDGDGIADGTEGTGDRDADGLRNLHDTDSDGDGVQDSHPQEGLDGDGDLLNTRALDDPDLPDFLDPYNDSDGDAFPNAHDPLPLDPTAPRGVHDVHFDVDPDAVGANPRLWLDWAFSYDGDTPRGSRLGYYIVREGEALDATPGGKETRWLLERPAALYGVEAARLTGSSYSVTPVFGDFTGPARTAPDPAPVDAWVRYFKDPDAATEEYFGSAVSVSADGHTLAVSAREGARAPAALGARPADGAVLVFDREGSDWSATPERVEVPLGYRLARNGFGASIALSGDGSTLAVGAPEHGDGGGIVYVYRRASSGSDFAIAFCIAVSELSPFAGEVTGILAEDAALGASLALSEDGILLAAGAPGARQGAGWAGVLELQLEGIVEGACNDDWRQIAVPAPGDTGEFGASVALSGYGDRLAVGAPGERVENWAGGDPLFPRGAVRVYGVDLGDGATQELARLTSRDPSPFGDGYAEAPDAADRFGAALTLSRDGQRIAIGIPRDDTELSGVVSGASLNAPERFRDSEDWYDSGAVAVFEQAADANDWNEILFLKDPEPAAETRFGSALAFGGEGAVVVVGAPFDQRRARPGLGGSNDPSGQAFGPVGAAHVFHLDTADGAQAGNLLKPPYMTNCNAANQDQGRSCAQRFGAALSLPADGGFLAVGAPWESSDPGIGPRDGSLDLSGAVFLY